MKKSLKWASRSACCVILAAAGLTPALAGLQRDFGSLTPASVDDQTQQLIITMRDQSPDEMPRRVRDVGASAAVALSHVRRMSGNAHVVRLERRMRHADARWLARLLAADPRVQNVEPDLRIFAQQLPNDPMFAQQWHYHEAAGGINLPAAWDITSGAPGLVIAVLDSGVTAHADLAGRLLPGYDFVANATTANDGGGRDANANDPGDYGCDSNNNGGSSNSSWHGTHVAGTLGASSSNSSGVSGINWRSRLLPVRVTGRCGGYTSDLIDGLRWSAGIGIAGIPANPNPARVANISLGTVSDSCSAAVQGAVDDVGARGMVVVAAAGNGGAAVSAFSPANCSGVIAVAATTRSGARASYSNTGSMVTIAAPGGGLGNGILSTVNTGLTSPAADGYASFQGTSMAAPHVAGTASLMLSANPTLTPAQLRQLMQGSARAFPVGTESDCRPGSCGAGIVDAGAAVAAALAGAPLAGTPPVSSTPPVPSTPPVASRTPPATAWTQCAQEGGICRFSGTRQVRYGANGAYAYQSASASLACSNRVFGDPVHGTLKSCAYAN
jgi:serine protease